MVVHLYTKITTCAVTQYKEKHKVLFIIIAVFYVSTLTTALAGGNLFWEISSDLPILVNAST